MDLVEIRKKAKSKKEKSAVYKEPVAEPVVEELPPEEIEMAEPVVAETPEEVAPPAADEDIWPAEEELPAEEPVDEPAPEPEPAVVEVSDTGKLEVDPLEALFAFQVDGELATEDVYLQALSSEDEMADSNTEQWLTFTLSDEEYALSIESVTEIIKPREVTEIPRVPGFIKGIISLRGMIVPVFDLSRRLNLGTAELGPSARIIVCQDEERIAGLLIDSINQVVDVPLKSIEPPPTVLSGLDRDFVNGVGRVDQRMLILLDLSNVINAELL